MIKSEMNQHTYPEGFFAGIIEANPCMTLVLHENRVMFANRACTEILGYSRDTLCSPDFDLMDLFHEDYRHLAARYLSVREPDTAASAFQCRLIASSGSVINVINYPREISYNGSNMTLLTLLDVTDHTMQEDTVQDLARVVSSIAGRDFFRTMAKHLARSVHADYAYIAEALPDRDNHIHTLAMLADGEFIDNMIVNLAGTPCETVEGRKTASYPSNVTGLFPNAHIMAQLKVEAYVGTSLFDSSGRHMGLMTVMFRSPIKNTGLIESMIKIFASRVSAEIERKRTIDALKRSENKFHQLIETANDAIFIADASTGIITDANRKAEEMLECNKDEIIGMHQTSLHPEEHREKYANVFKRHIDHGEFMTRDLEVITRTGRRIPVDISASVSEIDGTKVIQGIFRDITDAKESEKAILEYQEHLEEQVHKRTAELLKYQGQLRDLTSKMSLIEEHEKRRIATELHDRVGQTLALSKIKLGMLSKMPSDKVKVHIRELQDLIEQTLQETRTLTFELSPPILYELGLGPALKWLTDQFTENHGIAIELNNSDMHEDIDVNTRFFLFQAVRELIVNIIKHAGASLVSIDLSSRDERIYIVVKDNGKGFDTGSTHSDGYGLFNIRERMSHLNGSIEIRSNPGMGTAITLQAPLSTQDAISQGETN